MSGNKRDHVQEDFYTPFWARGREKRNPGELSTAFIQTMLSRVAGELCVNRFNWKGFPPSVDTRFLEVTLYHYALVVIFVDKVTGRMLACRAVPTGGYDMNQNPLAYRLMPLNNGQLPAHLQNLELSARNVVPIWSNAFRQPDWDIVEFYTDRLAQTERTIDINIENARMTKLIAADENQRLTIENINRMVQNGDKVIPITRAQMADIKDVITVLDMGVDFSSIATASEVRDRFWNNLMGMLGINNANQDKKERLSANETSGNDDQVGNFRRINLNWRQDAAKKIAMKWPELLTTQGMLTVEYHTDIDSERPLFPDEMGGDI